jgi:FAD/FMN-containing dehydrogenase
MPAERTRREVLLAATLGLLATGLAACTPEKTKGSGTSSPAPTSPTSHSTSPSPSAPTFASLAGQISGGLVVAGQAGYDPSTVLYNPRFGTQQQPAAIANCATAADLAACVRFAAAGGAPLRIRNGGHSYGGWSSGPGLVADLSKLNAISVDSGAMTATIGAGALLVHVYTQLAAHNVSIGGGSCATVGITGLTLGGGQGVLSRAYGLTCDQLRSVDIITADGRTRTVDTNTEPDLFWALRGGGGGSFGAVSALTFAVKPAPTITTFFLQWPWTDAATVLSAWQQWTGSLPREIWTTCKLLADPGRGLSVTVSGTSIGGSAPNLQGLLSATPPPTGNSHNTAGYGPTMLGEAGCAGQDVATCISDAFSPAKRQPFAATSSVLAQPLPAAGVNAIVSAVAAGMSVPRMVEGGVSFDALGGAVADVGATDSAFPWRSALAIAQYTATWDYANAAIDPSPFDTFVRGERAALAPWLGAAAYVNYADASLTDFATSYWGPNLARLQQVKKTYDPGNLFSFPQSVPLP